MKSPWGSTCNDLYVMNKKTPSRLNPFIFQDFHVICERGSQNMYVFISKSESQRDRKSVNTCENEDY